MILMLTLDQNEIVTKRPPNNLLLVSSGIIIGTRSLANTLNSPLD